MVERWGTAGEDIYTRRGELFEGTMLLRDLSRVRIGGRGVIGEGRDMGRRWH